MFEILNEKSGEVHHPEKKRISIGSSDSCDIVVVHEDVSPTQVFLTRTKLGYFLMNFHPDHVVTVNDEPVKEKMLKPGDRFHLGDVTFVIAKVGDSPTQQAPTEAADSAQAEPPAEAPPPAEEPPPPAEEPPAPAEPPSPEPSELPEPAEPAVIDMGPADVPPAPEEEPPPPVDLGPADVPPAPEEEPPPPVDLGPADVPPAPSPSPEAMAPSEFGDIPLGDETMPAEKLPSAEEVAAAAADDGPVVQEPAIEPPSPSPEAMAPSEAAAPSELAPWDVPVDDIEEQPPSEEPQPMSPEEAQALLGGPADAGADTEPQPIDVDNVEAMFAAEKERLDGDPAAQAPKIRLTSPNEPPREYTVTAPLTVGRENDNDIVLMARTVSRHHARIFTEGTELYIEDLGSAMGTKVNGQKVTRALLRPDDKILIGDGTLTVLGGAAEGQEGGLADRAAAAPAKTKVAVTPMLMVMGGNLDGKLFPVVGSMKVGTASDNPINLVADGVAEVHAEFEEEDGKLRVRDLSGGGGVRVNGAIVEDESLSKGDAVEIADILFLVRETVTRVPGEEDEGPITAQAAPTQKTDAPEAAQAPAGEPAAEAAPEPGAEPPAAPEEGKPDKAETPALGIQPLSIEDERPASGWPPPSVEAASFALVIVGGIMDGKTFPLTTDVTVGREGDNTIVLLDSTVSRHHAKFSTTDEGVKVVDNQSATGVFVNEVRVSDKILAHGDTVRIGNTRMVLKEADKTVSGAKAAAEEAPAKGALMVPKDGKVSDDHPSLLMTRGSDKGVQFELHGKTVFGRIDEVDVTINHGEASSRHAEITKVNGDWLVRDLGSTNGTWLNGTRVEEAFVRHGDTVEIAYHEFLFREPGRPIPPSGRKAPSLIVRIKGAARERRQRLAQELIIGRDKRHLIHVDNPLVSGNHARIFAEGRHYFVEDLGSTNGTWVKGQKITSKTMLQHGDSLFIGEASLTFKEPDKPLKTGVPMKKSTMAAVAVLLLALVAVFVVVVVFKDKIFPKVEPGPQVDRAENLLARNPGFESAADGAPLDGWTVSDKDDVEILEGKAKEGTYSLKMGKTSGEASREVVLTYGQTFPVQSNYVVYRVSGQFKADGVGGITCFRLQWLDEGGTPVYPASYSRFLSPSGQWQSLEGAFLPPPKPSGVAAMKVEVSVFSAGDTGVVLCDDLRFEAVEWKDLASEDQESVLKWPFLDSQEFTLRSNERGVFRVYRRGAEQPALQDAGIEIRQPGGQAVRQALSDLQPGSPADLSGSYEIKAELRDPGDNVPVSFSQLLEKTPDGKFVQVQYMLDSMSLSGALVFTYLAGSRDSSVTLVDRQKKEWQFQGAFSRKNDVSIAVLSVQGKVFSVGFEPPCALEAKEEGDVLRFTAYPALAAANMPKLVLSFYPMNPKEENELHTYATGISDALDLGQKGRAYALLMDGIKKFTSFPEKVDEWTKKAKELREEADRRIDNLKSRWNDFLKGVTDETPDEIVKQRVDGFRQSVEEIINDFQGCDLVLPAKNLEKEMKRLEGKRRQKEFKAKADRWFPQIEKALAAKNTILARILLKSFDMEGITDFLPEDLADKYEEFQATVKKLMEANVDALLAEAKKLEDANELEKALETYRQAARTCVDDPGSDAVTNPRALEIAIKIRELQKRIR